MTNQRMNKITRCTHLLVNSVLHNFPGLFQSDIGTKSTFLEFFLYLFKALFLECSISCIELLFILKCKKVGQLGNFPFFAKDNLFFVVIVGIVGLGGISFRGGFDTDAKGSLENVTFSSSFYGEFSCLLLFSANKRLFMCFY